MNRVQREALEHDLTAIVERYGWLTADDLLQVVEEVARGYFEDVKTPAEKFLESFVKRLQERG